jgi:diguanylate cyclase (GGDEF)-like protein/PAS domain S-box-containing protein
MAAPYVLIFLLLPFLAFSQARAPSAQRHTLHTVDEIYALPRAEAAKAYPVDFEAEVTYSDPEWGELFVQDRTGTTYIDVHGSDIVYPLGTRVRVKAVTGANYNGTQIVHPAILVLGPGTLPKPEQRSVADLDAGVGEAHRAVSEGVLHPCERDWHRVCFRLYDGKKSIWLTVPVPDGPVAQRLIGATVQVTGIASRYEDSEHRRVGAQLFVNTLKDIKVESPPLPISFSSSPTPIGNLRASEADERFVKQVHVRGTVTWQSPGLFSIEGGTGTLFVGTAEMQAVRTGSTVDAIGFPSHGKFGLELEDSVVSLSEVQPNAGSITPLRATAAEVVQRSLNGRRVRLKARLIGQSADATEFVYQLEDGEQRFNAILLRNDATHEVVGLSRDSVLDLTGVALIQKGTPEWPNALLILVESPKDIVVIGGNGWLTLKRGLTILGCMALCVVAPLLWVTSLKRTVRKQTGIIRARLQNELQLETRYRRLFERNLAAVFSWRPDGTIVDCNLAFVRLLGFKTREDLIGRSYWDFQVDPARREKLSKALQEETLSSREASLRRDDGVTVHLLKNITPVDTAEGTVYETTAIDVTQLRQNQTELQRAKDAAVHESLNDSLTGLPNRKHLQNELSYLVAKAKQDAGMIAVLYIDLDGFKMVNDSLGHPIGDALLVQVATSLRSSVREEDVVARFGGDEFIVILDKVHAREDAALVARSLIQEISKPFHVQEHDVAIGASIGISIFPDDATDGDELIREADCAMYAAKREGKNRVLNFNPEIDSLVHERSSLENLLRGALARDEISVHYQPEFDLADNRLTRFEALARWTHPTLGEIPPCKFIPIAEESGLIVPLGIYILHQACIEAVRWQSVVPQPIQVAVNISSIQFRSEGFVEEVSTILQLTGLQPELLQIELTESIMLNETRQVAETMHRLRELGISLAIDDFGTEYSSLSYLPSLPFDTLKIDRSFVMNLDKQPENESVIRMLVALAHNAGMSVIVEGVETPEQLEFVRALGANEAQGYLLGRPTANPSEDFLCPPSTALCLSSHHRPNRSEHPSVRRPILASR